MTNLELLTRRDFLQQFTATAIDKLLLPKAEQAKRIFEWGVFTRTPLGCTCTST